MPQQQASLQLGACIDWPLSPRDAQHSQANRSCTLAEPGGEQLHKISVWLNS